MGQPSFLLPGVWFLWSIGEGRHCGYWFILFYFKNVIYGVTTLQHSRGVALMSQSFGDVCGWSTTQVLSVRSLIILLDSNYHHISWLMVSAHQQNKLNFLWLLSLADKDKDIYYPHARTRTGISKTKKTIHLSSDAYSYAPFKWSKLLKTHIQRLSACGLKSWPGTPEPSWQGPFSRGGVHLFLKPTLTSWSWRRPSQGRKFL